MTCDTFSSNRKTQLSWEVKQCLITLFKRTWKGRENIARPQDELTCGGRGKSRASFNNLLSLLTTRLAQQTVVDKKKINNKGYGIYLPVTIKP